MDRMTGQAAAKAAATSSAGKGSAAAPSAQGGGLTQAPTSFLGREAARAYQTLLGNMPRVTATQVKVLPTAQQARIMTRAEWQAARAKAGGKAGMVRGVDLGSLLDAWHKAMSRQPSFTMASRSVDKQTYALIVGLNKYKKDPTVAKTLALRETVEQLLKALDAHITRAGTADREAKKVGAALNDLRATATGPLAFKKLQTQVKLVGTAFRDLSTVEPSVSSIGNWWSRQVDQRVSQGGVAANKNDTVDYQRASAAGLANLADAVRTELAKNGIVE